MRHRALFSLALLVVPVALSAQRFPRIGSRRPAEPTALPPQPPAIARSLAYKRLRLSVESYPMVSFVSSPGFGATDAVSHWTSFGAGTRADYRVTRRLSATLDMTSSFLGGLARTETVELGTRLRPERNDRRFYPFLDLRAGYANAYDSYFGPFSGTTGLPFDQTAYGGRYSQGFGGIAGVGTEIALTRSWSVTTSGSVMRSGMRAYEVRGTRPGTGRFTMTQYRYMAGLRYNPVRLIQPPMGPQ